MRTTQETPAIVTAFDQAFQECKRLQVKLAETEELNAKLLGLLQDFVENTEDDALDTSNSVLAKMRREAHEAIQEAKASQ
jgi:hypothetical protein